MAQAWAGRAQWDRETLKVFLEETAGVLAETKVRSVEKGRSKALGESLGGNAFMSCFAPISLIFPKQNLTQWTLFMLVLALVANFSPPGDFSS